MLHRVPHQVAWDLHGCGRLLQILLAENPLLYLLILLHKVEYRVLWVDIVLQDSIEAFTPCCCLEEGEETMHEIRRDPTMSHVIQMLEPLIIVELIFIQKSLPLLLKLCRREAIVNTILEVIRQLLLTIPLAIQESTHCLPSIFHNVPTTIPMN